MWKFEMGLMTFCGKCQRNYVTLKRSMLDPDGAFTDRLTVPLSLFLTELFGGTLQYGSFRKLWTTFNNRYGSENMPYRVKPLCLIPLQWKRGVKKIHPGCLESCQTKTTAVFFRGFHVRRADCQCSKRAHTLSTSQSVLLDVDISPTPFYLHPRAARSWLAAGFLGGRGSSSHVVRVGLGRSKTMGAFMGRKLTVQAEALTKVVVPSVIIP